MTEGKTGDDISLSPFSNAVLSEYIIDELLTIPIDSAANAYKKHFLFLLTFPEIPVFKSITQFSKESLDSITQYELLRERDFAGQVAAKRALALTSPEHLRDLQTDIKNKLTGLEAAKMFFVRDSTGKVLYTDEKNRITVAEAIERIVAEQKLMPVESAYDFYILCMSLYVATRDRLIKVGKDKKGENAALNMQIDFYHLSYLPFVNEFVTNDNYLCRVAKELIKYLRLDKTVRSGQEYLNLWFHELLSGD
jgi:hypothetical protein